jgi:hypothetical protein
VLYGCETWSFSPATAHEFEQSADEAIRTSGRRIKREMGRKVHKEVINNLYSSHIIIREHEPNRMKYARHDEEIFIAKSYEERRGVNAILQMLVVKINSTRPNDVLS